MQTINVAGVQLLDTLPQPLNAHHETPHLLKTSMLPPAFRNHALIEKSQSAKPDFERQHFCNYPMLLGK